VRKLFGVGAVLALAVALSGCGGSNGRSSSDQELQQQADSFEISQIERDFHESMSKKNIGQMMALWAPNATFTFGPGQTATGKAEIQKTWLKSKAFDPATHWVSDHPAYKLEVTIDGDRGTLHFECHFIDRDTRTVAALTAGDLDVVKSDGKWFITKMVGGTSEL
jgi:ketosteroid isomerase-like protein